MTSPAFADEMTDQLRRASAALVEATAAADDDAAAAAAARLADLVDLTRRRGVDVEHVTAPWAGSLATG